MRTEAASGLLFYMARINHADFATVQLRHGLPYFSYDLGSGDTNTMIPTKINDGQWHKVKGPAMAVVMVVAASSRGTRWQRRHCPRGSCCAPSAPAVLAL